ncbi:MAG TPA: formylglycine-generating enzyme family protein, partial [Planctomycetaceae bacterium]
VADSAVPERQSQAIQRLAQYGVLPETLLVQIRTSNDDSLRRVLILGLGEFEFEQLGQPQRETIANELTGLYRDHPDSGIHGAAEWCLSRWNLGAKLAAAVSDLRTGRVEGSRRWYLARDGQTFVMCQGGTFVMGSPVEEKWRIGTEARHRTRVDRQVAAATAPVTVEQFQRFLRDQGIRRTFNSQYSPESGCPQTELNWFDAVRYCNWLSDREGIPPSQWCYEPNASGEYAPGMKLAANYLSRSGYRLPSEAEWEFLCRAGSTTARFFGDSDELLPRYAWFNQNSHQRSWPVGRLKPNAFGMFDVLGNVFQWCQDQHVDYPAGSIEVDPDRERSLLVEAGVDRVIRGGAFNRDAATLRSAARNMEHPGFRNYPLGFRVVRTYP